MSTKRNFDPEHRVDMWQARCSNCGEIEDEYGDFSAWGDPDTPRNDVVENLGWFERWSYTPNPTPENPRGRIGTLDELLCNDCQECEVCEAKPATDFNDDGHLVCGNHEDEFTAATA